MWRFVALCGDMWRNVGLGGVFWRDMAFCGDMWRYVGLYVVMGRYVVI